MSSPATFNGPAVPSPSARHRSPAGNLPTLVTGEARGLESIRATGFAAFGLLKPLPPAEVQPSAVSLADRVPGQSVITQALALQAGVPPRSWWARVRGADPLSAEAAPWYQGAVGEIAVGAILARLGPEWTVLHAVPVGDQGADIDHVLIGPAGVFTLNTKHHADQSIWVAGRTLMVGGQKQTYIPKAFHETIRAAKLLSTAVGEPVPVNGVLVLVDPRGITIREEPAGVAVVTDRQLLHWLTRRPPVLTPEQVARIAAAAARPAAWSKHPLEVQDPAVLREAFDTLDRQVRVARRRRRAWRLGARGVRTGVRAADRAEKALLRGLLRLALALLLLGVGINLLESLA